jgi:hypothetical protein
MSLMTTKRALYPTLSENNEILCRFPRQGLRLDRPIVFLAIQLSGSRADALSMPGVDIKRIESAREDERQPISPLVYAFVILSVFVLAVIRMWVEDGASTAVVTAVAVIAIAATAIGLCGTAMAVRDTDEFTSRSED